MATQQARVLRVGVVQGGKIVEERLFRNRQLVSIGTAPGNTIVIPQSSLPPSFPVFQVQGDQYILVFDTGMEGRIQGTQGSVDFGALIGQGLARKHGEHFAIPLRSDQRGRIVLGEVTLLFQFVNAPPEPPRPVLPETMKGNHFRTLDRLFVSVLVISFVLHLSAYVALASTPARREITLEEMPERFARLVMPERKPQPPKKIEGKPTEAGTAKKESDAGKKNRDGGKPAGSKAERTAAVNRAVQSKGILRVLGSLGGPGGRGSVADVFGSGGGFGDVATALSGAGGVAMGTEPGEVGGRKGGGQGGTAHIGDLATTGDGGGKVGYGKKSEAPVAGKVATEVAEVESADIDQSKLGSFVRVRISSIKACYEHELKRNPRLRGKIRIEFTILETGRLADFKILENTLGSAEVAGCMIGIMRGWRTPFHPSGTVTVVYPFVFSAN